MLSGKQAAALIKKSKIKGQSHEKMREIITLNDRLGPN
jgi:hypothetical protein